MTQKVLSILRSRAQTVACPLCRSGNTKAVPVRKHGWDSVHSCNNCSTLFDGGQVLIKA